MAAPPAPGTALRPPRAPRAGQGRPVARPAGLRSCSGPAVARLALAEGGADAAHRADQLRPEPLAQLVHVDADGVALHFLAPAVQAVLELRARQDRAGPLQQGLENGPP